MPRSTECSENFTASQRCSELLNNFRSRKAFATKLTESSLNSTRTFVLLASGKHGATSTDETRVKSPKIDAILVLLFTNWLMP